jgi:hypothetical protein
MKMECKLSAQNSQSKSSAILATWSLILNFSLTHFSRARQKYYKANNVGWCARPPHKKDGYLRKGQFKKASNMNYCLDFSIRVEDELLRLIAEYEQANPGESGKSLFRPFGLHFTVLIPCAVTVDKENELYAHATQTIISSDEGRTWAEGNVRLGEFILLLDCDTKVVSRLLTSSLDSLTSLAC